MEETSTDPTPSNEPEVAVEAEVVMEAAVEREPREETEKTIPEATESADEQETEGVPVSETAIEKAPDEEVVMEVGTVTMAEEAKTTDTALIDAPEETATEVPAAMEAIPESAVKSPLTSIDPPVKKLPIWLRMLVVFLKVIFLTPFYLAIALLAFGGGVGWHYFEGSAGLDLGEVERLEVGALVKDVHGREIGRAGTMSRLLIDREDIPADFVDALVAAEDQRFFIHLGFDPVGSVRAAWANYRAEAIKEGASTLTQQLARDVYRLEGKDADRKLSEIAAAVRIEDRYSKDEILVHYLNRVYFGSGFYGLGAAARGYFGKEAKDLTVDEAALLCGLIPSPSRYSPLVSESRAIENRDQTLRRMHETGKLTDQELNRFLAQKTVVDKSREHLLDRGQLTYLLARVERELRAVLEKQPEPIKALDGLTVETSIDLALQQKAAKEIDQHINSLTKDEGGKIGEGTGLEAAFVLIENHTGRIVVSVGSRDFQNSEYDRALEMTRPPGSAFFPFVYAAAFETGAYTPESTVFDAPFDNREMGLGSIGGVLGEWSTENPENRWDGHISAADALRYSKNSPTARLGLQVGLGPVRKLIAAAGIRSELNEAPGSLLGNSEANLTELTHAYTAFPNGGTPAPEPGLIREIRDASGNSLLPPVALNPGPAMSEKTARAVVESLTGKGEGGARKGKSGTTPGFTDVWYFGFDEDYTWGTWLGRDSFIAIHPLAFGGVLARPLADAILAGRNIKDPALPVAASEKP